MWRWPSLLVGQALAKVVLSFVLVPVIIWLLVRLAGTGRTPIVAD